MAEITATERPWRSATHLYIARKLQQLAEERGQQLKVMDLGCGDGDVIRQLHEYGHDLYGYDDNERVLRQTLEPIFGDEWDKHIHIMQDERSIPFEDNVFDVIYSNQVFEHVRFMERIIGECARVLRPGGIVITLFPFATYPLEGHTKIPFAHWIPPGRLRVRYMWLYFLLRLRPRSHGKTAMENAEYWEYYLNHMTYYHFMNEVVSYSNYYFESWELDSANYMQARLDMWKARPGIRNRILYTICLGHAANGS